jgi:hypothetical protein
MLEETARRPTGLTSGAILEVLEPRRAAFSSMMLCEPVHRRGRLVLDARERERGVAQGQCGYLSSPKASFIRNQYP